MRIPMLFAALKRNSRSAMRSFERGVELERLESRVLLSGSYHLTFDEEFNTQPALGYWGASTSAGTNTWKASDRGGNRFYGNGTGDWQYYVDPTKDSTAYNPFSTTGGVLSITADTLANHPTFNNTTRPYLSGIISTAPGVDPNHPTTGWTQQYGYFEVKAKLPGGLGMWPAFWLLPADGSWPPEYDIMENWSDFTWTNYPNTGTAAANTGKIYQTTHYTNTAGTNTGEGITYTNINGGDGYHTYGLEWTPTTATYYVDGVTTHTFGNRSDKPMYILLNLGFGVPGVDDFTKVTNRSSATLPGAYQIDWVHAYSNDSAVAAITPQANYVASVTPGTPVLISQGKTITASSSVSGYGATAGNDGNATTRWASASADNQWLDVGLGTVSTINEVKLNWMSGTYASHATSFKIQTSMDNTNWTDIYSTTAGTGGVADLTNLTGSGRYVRMLGLTRVNPAYGYSLYEFQVYGNPATASLLSQGKTVTASSQVTSYEATKAVDGDGGTRWASASADNQWLSVDLGAVKSVSEVKLNWLSGTYASYATSFKIQVSTDGVTWTDIYSTTTGAGGLQDITGLTGTGRYVRMLGLTRVNPAYGFSLYEFQVYGY